MTQIYSGGERAAVSSKPEAPSRTVRPAADGLPALEAIRRDDSARPDALRFNVAAYTARLGTSAPAELAASAVAFGALAAGFTDFMGTSCSEPTRGDELASGFVIAWPLVGEPTGTCEAAAQHRRGSYAQGQQSQLAPEQIPFASKLQL